MKTVDTRGMSCPIPVVMVQHAAREDNELVVLIDDVCAVENVTRFAANNGFSVKREDKEDEFKLTLKRK